MAYQPHPDGIAVYQRWQELNTKVDHPPRQAGALGL
jgi:hypothetical protein